MTCEEAIAHIHACGRFSGKPGLHRIRALMYKLGDPQKKLRFVHIAGTNGKGSTATMIASILRESGYRVGLYTSPYLLRFHERISVNGELISDQDLVRLVVRTEQAAAYLNLPPEEHIGEFEFVTAIAFQYFFEQACDIVILETGLGGEFDATNVIDAPDAAVITSISLDHMAVLGNTLPEIAKTKAGIIKPGSAVITTCGQSDEVYAILREAAADLIIAPKPKLEKINLQGETFTVGNDVYHTTLLGTFQIENASTAISAVKALTSHGYKISEKNIRSGLEKAKIAARLETVRKEPLVVIDGGHNEDGVRATVESLYAVSGCKDFTLVIGMVSDKAIEACIRKFSSIARRIIVTQPQNARAFPAKQMAEIVQQYCRDVVSFNALPDALDYVLNDAGADEKIIICGSLYLAGEAKQYFIDRQNPTRS